eukprot:GHVU01143356.1.p1 GENE.GHVU01143356.1~~GHVU01143356.1.p1  ORF type:complete len:345 (-),score=47.05 GHVU01143356.1:3108-4142(-)
MESSKSSSSSARNSCPAKRKRSVVSKKPSRKRQERGNSEAIDGLFTPEAVVGKGSVKGKMAFVVKWKGFPEEENSLEPLENLAGCEELIIAFCKREGLEFDKIIEDLNNSNDIMLDVKEEEEDEDEQELKQYSSVWQVFEKSEDAKHCRCLPPCKEKAFHAVCQVKGCIWSRRAYNTTNLWSHLKQHHPTLHQRLLASSRRFETDDPVDASTTPLSEETKQKADYALALWMTKTCRPPHMLKDKEFNQWVRLISQRAYSLPSAHLLNKHKHKLEELATLGATQIIDNLKETGIRVSLSADIWSKNDASLFGAMAYGIVEVTDRFIMVEILIAAAPFGKVGTRFC